jgi:hypothetical protein
MDFKITRAGSGLPSRIVLHGVEGIGKTTFAAFAPDPLFVMPRGETGLLTLIDNSRIPERDHFAEVPDWFQLMRIVDHTLNAPEVKNKTFVIDVLGGAARLCEEYVVNREFKGEWASYQAYGKGPEVAVGEWMKLFAKLDELRVKKRMAVLCLAHTIVRSFKNPEADDYDRYVPEMHDKLWRVVAKWADIILFGNFETFAKKERGELKAKGSSTGRRLLFTQRTAAWDAKNRVGLPPEIDMGERPEESFSSFAAQMKLARAAAQVVKNTAANAERIDAAEKADEPVAA